MGVRDYFFHSSPSYTFVQYNNPVMNLGINWNTVHNKMLIKQEQNGDNVSCKSILSHAQHVVKNFKLYCKSWKFQLLMEITLIDTLEICLILFG